MAFAVRSKTIVSSFFALKRNSSCWPVSESVPQILSGSLSSTDGSCDRLRHDLREIIDEQFLLRRFACRSERRSAPLVPRATLAPAVTVNSGRCPFGIVVDVARKPRLVNFTALSPPGFCPDIWIFVVAPPCMPRGSMRVISGRWRGLGLAAVERRRWPRGRFARREYRKIRANRRAGPRRPAARHREARAPGAQSGCGSSSCSSREVRGLPDFHRAVGRGRGERLAVRPRTPGSGSAPSCAKRVNSSGFVPSCASSLTVQMRMRLSDAAGGDGLAIGRKRDRGLLLERLRKRIEPLAGGHLPKLHRAIRAGAGEHFAIRPETQAEDAAVVARSASESRAPSATFQSLIF